MMSAAASLRTWLVTLCVVLGCRTSEPEPAPTSGSTASAVPPSEPDEATPGPTAQLAPDVICGMNYVHAWQDDGVRGYGSEESASQLDELAALGVQSVAITTFAWMASVHDAQVHGIEDVGGGETAARMRAVAAQASERGLGIVYKPHLWIRRGAWRGDIDPDPSGGGWPAWFDSYEAWIVAQARLAEEVGADWFVVGVEFVSAVRHDPARWREIIAAVRDVYSGRVTYAANWDEVAEVPFWDALDAVGVQMFAPLTDLDDATPEQMREGAAEWLTHYEQVSRTVDRPLLLTEVGYMNRAGTTREPWVWPERLPAGDHGEGDEEQAQAFAAVVTTFGRSEHVVGMWWWKWFTDPDTDEEGAIGFSPRGRRAEAVLREACAGRSG